MQRVRIPKTATMAPRILYTQSKIVSPHLDAETFCSWYDTTHMAEMFNLPKSPNVAYRYMAIDESHQTWQILVIYIMDDPAFLSIPVPKDKFTYKHPRFPDKPTSDFLVFDAKDYAFVGDEGTAFKVTEKSKWAVHAEFAVDDTNSQQTEAMLKEECREGVEYSRYRLESIPATGKKVADYDGPKELAIFNIGQKEDIDRVIESLDRKFKGIGATIKFATWEFAKALAK